MKSLFLGATALVGIVAAGAASAADLPRRAAPPPVFTPVPVFTWTGFYAGVNAGYGFGTTDNRNPTIVAFNNATGVFNTGGIPAGGVAAFSNSRSNEGFVGGGQVGYNYQFTPGNGFVVGIEADAQYVDFGRSRNNAAFFTVPAGGTLNPGVVLTNPNGLSGLDYFGTVRGRLGYAFGRTLVYGTGGFAYGSGGGNDFGLPNQSRDSFRTGWAAGGGVEYALPTDSFLNFFRSSAVTLKVEGLYVNLDRNAASNIVAFNTLNGGTLSAFNPNVAVVSGLTNRRNDDFAVVRAGLNYKFGSY